MTASYSPVPYYLFVDGPTQAQILREQIESAVLDRLHTLMANEAMDIARMRIVAQYTLDHLTEGASTQEILKSLGTFTSACAELTPVIVKFLQLYERHAKTKAMKEIEGELAVQDYAAVSDTAQRAINYQI
ncbi:MAG: hypothetical protein WCO78_00910 [Candidatus Roizmanbacteria bacterium]